jgi:hypothetical protein
VRTLIKCVHAAQQTAELTGGPFRDAESNSARYSVAATDCAIEELLRPR